MTMVVSTARREHVPVEAKQRSVKRCMAAKSFLCTLKSLQLQVSGWIWLWYCRILKFRLGFRCSVQGALVASVQKCGSSPRIPCNSDCVATGGVSHELNCAK